MRRKSVVSSNIDSIGYENGTLEVAFKSGAVWQYFDVPQNIYNDMMDATSIGSYFSKLIRPIFKAEKISE